MGFPGEAWIGSREEYQKFMGFNVSDDNPCIPDYKVAGAICGTSATNIDKVKNNTKLDKKV